MARGSPRPCSTAQRVHLPQSPHFLPMSHLLETPCRSPAGPSTGVQDAAGARGVHGAHPAGPASSLRLQATQLTCRHRPGKHHLGRCLWGGEGSTGAKGAHEAHVPSGRGGHQAWVSEAARPPPAGAHLGAPVPTRRVTCGGHRLRRRGGGKERRAGARVWRLPQERKGPAGERALSSGPSGAARLPGHLLPAAASPSPGLRRDHGVRQQVPVRRRLQEPRVRVLQETAPASLPRRPPHLPPQVTLTRCPGSRPAGLLPLEPWARLGEPGHLQRPPGHPQAHRTGSSADPQGEGGTQWGNRQAREKVEHTAKNRNLRT